MVVAGGAIRVHNSAQCWHTVLRVRHQIIADLCSSKPISLCYQLCLLILMPEHHQCDLYIFCLCLHFQEAPTLWTAMTRNVLALVLTMCRPQPFLPAAAPQQTRGTLWWEPAYTPPPIVTNLDPILGGPGTVTATQLAPVATGAL